MVFSLLCRENIYLEDFVVTRLSSGGEKRKKQGRMYENVGRRMIFAINPKSCIWAIELEIEEEILTDRATYRVVHLRGKTLKIILCLARFNNTCSLSG